ncbi:flagellar hook-basal body complex protein FliE [Campylobacter fetus]|uniref:Flagellar hook-basal body complex protein FliE n=2 Tax=Campylobacter fetus TaxID=196 RepID=A0A5L4XQL6_CAMFE|nr:MULTISPECIES: flagellar hook-basal body complex protein FliE [Campylobacter]HDX6329693.1 flagellar hook-basal body complex protein FliE [Campylobacter fetus subsp. venerealis]ABK81769.1 flagellar hook-basal body complex protein (FliE) [Campylobacter fetus subsp. fetus 82-40]AIR78626.1 flagellar proximal rod protein [Campylobacter fetus subsp. fetus 04/554]EAH8299600.1 flagellar hook-basal body complex protein FliE [Campylobacter fetus]EAI3886212.1 flagellar hook-basal body complex protein F
MNISEISNLNQTTEQTKQKDGAGSGFSDMLNKALSDLNDVQEKADKAVADLATGEVKDLHQAAIAIGKAETSMKLMLEVRNKAINAYKEISRTQL